jgi:hypothetical protein
MDSSSQGTQSDVEFLNENESPFAYKLRARLEDVSEFLEDLLKVSILIRKSGVPSRMLRAAAYGFEDNEDARKKLRCFENDYLPRLLQHRYGIQYPLKQRLCKAISIRLRRFEYLKAHQQKLDSNFNHGSPAQPGKRQVPTQSGNTVSYTKEGEDVVLPLPPPQSPPNAPASRLLASTNATPYKALAAPSVASHKSNRSAGSFTHLVGIPAPPRPPGKVQYISCPYCCILIPKESLDRKSWK